MRNSFLTFQPKYHTKWKNFISQQSSPAIFWDVSSLMAASAVWNDSETLSFTLTVFKTAIHTITDILLEISIEMPTHLKRHLQPYYKEDAWVTSDREMQTFFNQCSSRFGTKYFYSLNDY